MEELEVEVAQMGAHFIYLPIYYAIHKKFFGYLDAPRCKYTIAQQLRKVDPETDEAVFNALMNDRAEQYQNVLFAIGDPRSLAFKRNITDLNAVLLGALVTGTAFWAIDHGRKSTIEVNDLARFKKIVSFKQGSTSYDLAASIAGKANPNTQILQVDPDQEFQVLLDPGYEDVVVLSPNMIRIVDLLRENSRCAIELSIGRHYEYCDLLITAIATTKETVQNHPILVQGFIKGVQRALHEFHARSPELIKYAQDRFKRDEKSILDAFSFADEAHVYPYTIQLTEALWMRAITGPLKTNGATVTAEQRFQALQVYGHIARPYEKLVKEAIQNIESGASLSGGGSQTPNHSSIPLAVTLDVFATAYLVLTIALASQLGARFSFWGVGVSLLIAVVTTILGSYTIRDNPKTISARIAFWFGSALLQIAIFLAFLGWEIPPDSGSFSLTQLGRTYIPILLSVGGCYWHSIQRWTDDSRK